MKSDSKTSFHKLLTCACLILPTIVFADTVQKERRLEQWLTADGMTPFCAAQRRPADFCHATRSNGQLTVGEISNGDLTTFLNENWLDSEQIDEQTVLSYGERLIERRPASDWPTGAKPDDPSFDDAQTTTEDGVQYGDASCFNDKANCMIFFVEMSEERLNAAGWSLAEIDELNDLVDLSDVDHAPANTWFAMN